MALLIPSPFGTNPVADNKLLDQKITNKTFLPYFGAKSDGKKRENLAAKWSRGRKLSPLKVRSNAPARSKRYVFPNARLL